MALAMDTPAVVVTGSTYGVNISYPDHEKFDVLDMGGDLRMYDPIRITPDEESSRMNDGIMAMNDKVEEVIVKSVDKFMNKYYVKPETEVILPDNMCGPEGCPSDGSHQSSKPLALKGAELSGPPPGMDSDFKIPALAPEPKKGFSVKNK